MKQRFTLLSLMAALLVMATTAGTLFAQDAKTAVPRYEVRTPHLRADDATPATPLTTWDGSFEYNGTTYKYNMVGTNPTTGTSTTIKVFLIPIALKITSGGKTTTFTPETKQSVGYSAVTITQHSPIFEDMQWTSPKGTNLGKTQYEDAFQRGNFWSTVQNEPNYHVLLTVPTVAPVQTLTVPEADGTIADDFGITVGNVDINWIDAQFQTIIAKYPEITPGTFPIFITYNTYLTDDGCCIGGYHSSEGSFAAPQAYAHFTYISTPGIFAQDVSALSHETGEYIDDPLVVNTNGNPVECGILEVGDPEEGFNEDGATYGAFPYVLSGFTFHLQDLVYLEYFGAPNTTSVDGGTESFHDNPFGLGICNNGG
jgi:hypothetical protein